ncbi:MAG: hypothetical protein AAGF85_14060 [Bacteroidota bacterium]
MKNVFFGILLMLMVTSCNENDANPLDLSCIEVSYVDGICAAAILQIEDERFFYLGETANGFENVFFTTLPCSFDDPILNSESFYISIIEDDDLGDCIRCLATISYSGEKAYSIANSICSE